MGLDGSRFGREHVSEEQNMSSPSIAVVTGTSSGFGFDTARLLAEAGHRVYATMRDAENAHAEAARKLKALGVHIVALDITDQASVDRAAKTILEAEGRVDILINNAGASFIGTL